MRNKALQSYQTVEQCTVLHCNCIFWAQTMIKLAASCSHPCNQMKRAHIAHIALSDQIALQVSFCFLRILCFSML